MAFSNRFAILCRMHNQLLPICAEMGDMLFSVAHRINRSLEQVNDWLASAVLLRAPLRRRSCAANDNLFGKGAHEIFEFAQALGRGALKRAKGWMGQRLLGDKGL